MQPARRLLSCQERLVLLSKVLAAILPDAWWQDNPQRLLTEVLQSSKLLYTGCSFLCHCQLLCFLMSLLCLSVTCTAVSSHTSAGRRGKRVALTPAAIVRHSPPARGALPPRPAIRTGSMSSLASESEVSTATGQVSASALGSRRSADGQGNSGGLGAEASRGGVGSSTPLQQHPMRLTMELMHSLSPPIKGAECRGQE